MTSFNEAPALLPGKVMRLNYTLKSNHMLQ